MSSPNVNSVQRHEPMLRESIHHFFALYHKGCSDFSTLESIFFRLMQTMPDPPLEVIWFHSAVTFHSSKRAHPQQVVASKKMLMASDLFQVFVSFSSSCSGSRRVAVLAPLVYELSNLVCEYSNHEFSMMREIDDLLESIESYISMFSGNGLENETCDLLVCFEDLVKVWTVDRVREPCKFGENLRVFFPVLTDNARRKIDKGFGMNFLAGIVMNEVLCLRLCLKFDLGVPVQALHTEMQKQAVQTVNGFQNCYFLDMLLRMLLEPTFPLTSVLSSGNADLLRKVLYDAVILVDSLSLNFGVCNELCDKDLNHVALLWSLVADNGIQFARDTRDINRAISYVNAFSKSHFPNQLIEWISNQSSIENKTNRPSISTPRDLINWMLHLKDQTLEVLDHDVLKFHAKPAMCIPAGDCELLQSKEDYGKNDFFDHRAQGIVENEIHGDQEMSDPLNGPFLLTEGRRKRKDVEMEDGETLVKYAKFNSPEGFRGASLLGNAVSDEYMEDMV